MLLMLEQMLERELLLFVCRYHIYEPVLKSAFETKILQVTKIFYIVLYKKVEIIGIILTLLTFELIIIKYKGRRNEVSLCSSSAGFGQRIHRRGHYYLSSGIGQI